MSTLTRWIDATLYPEHGDHWDDELFRSEILDVLSADSRVLDLGAGSGRLPQMDLSTHAARVCGIDPHESVLDNPYLDEARVARGESIPYGDKSFDVVVADNVLEHVADPVSVFREVARVLTSGGLFLAKTPNRRHYVPLVARCTPQRFHEWVNRARGRDDADTFPTLYRANSRRQIARAAAAANLVVRRLAFVEGRPEYLRNFGPGYLLGFGYERLVNSTSLLASFRVVMLVVLQKEAPGAGHTARAS